MKAVKDKYENRRKRYGRLLQKQKNADRKISNLRLVTFAAGAFTAVSAYIARSYMALAGALAASAIMFIYLVIYQEKLINRIKYTTLLQDINNTSLERLNGKWNTFADTGEDFIEDDHDYSGDLDIFGRGSLFQWINAARTFAGRKILRDLLSGVIGSSIEIRERQAAIDELAAMLNWRQRFSAEGMMASEKLHNPDELIAWGKESCDIFRKPWLILLIRIYPVVTVLLIAAGFAMDIIPRYIPTIALLIQFAAVSWNTKARYGMFGLFEKYNEDLRVCYKMLKLFENPEWAIPEIKDLPEPVLEAKAVGHPLLIGKRVHNDIEINGKAKVLLITGSNMSGKSTFLRTAGINLVLAYAGAPVCAGRFVASIMNIYTCMRIKDNLEENISSFYAELLRIKRIFSEAESGKRVFFLLDEIFKGTNSKDRHTGARVLISKLSHTNSIGMVSTHDFELCDLEQKNSKIVNYHFQEHYEDGKINFDYRLRQGSSKTRNALHLMRLAGIEVDG